VVEHEDALTQAVDAYLEAGTIDRERIVATEPFAGVVGSGFVRVVLPVIEDHFKHPTGILQSRLREKTQSEAFDRQQ
jgi:hypothetical protein